jgi:hypothetical protein
MSAVQGSRVNRGTGVGGGRDVGEIQSLEKALPPQSVSTAELNPGAASVSLPLLHNEVPSAIEPLTRYLGPDLTVGNPAWTGDPVPKLRGLQRSLIEHSLTLDESERGTCLTALTIVEKAVGYRLRLQQLQMTELDVIYAKAERERA